MLALKALNAGIDGNETRTMAEMEAEEVGMATYSFSPEHPHGPQATATLRKGDEPPAAPSAGIDATSATAAFRQPIMGMHDEMMDGLRHEASNVAFVLGMIPLIRVR